MPHSPDDDLATFEALRPELTALGYRMLADLGRAQELVQEAWLRWHQRDVEVHSPRAFLLTTVSRLCLNELGSARARREESRSDRLPEPVDLASYGLERVVALEQVSIAFMRVLERLTPSERAVLLLHDVFDFAHEEIGSLLERSPSSSRKLLERAKSKVGTGRRTISASREEHRRLLDAFLHAVSAGDLEQLVALLAEDATIITDGGATGRRVGRTRNLPRPLRGARRVATFLLQSARSTELVVEHRELNGHPGVVFRRHGAPFAALQLEIADSKIAQIFFHADLTRLGHVD